MSVSLVNFLAWQVADLDWQAVGENCNPYSKEKQPDQYATYEDRYALLDDDWSESIYRGKLNEFSKRSLGNTESR